MLMQVLAILIMLRRYLSSSMTAFRYFHNIWSDPGEEELLHLLMVFLNSFLEKDSCSIVGFDKNSSNRLRFIEQFWAESNI